MSISMVMKLAWISSSCLSRVGSSMLAIKLVSKGSLY